LLPWANRVRRRIGFAGAHFASLLTERVPLEGPPSLAGNLELVKRLGCDAAKKDYVGLLRVSETQRTAAQRWLREAGWDEAKPLAVIAAGASKRQAIKQWTEEGFAEVADRLSETMQVALVGLESVDGITQRLRRPVLDLTMKTNLLQLAAALSRAALFVGVDSGVMHVAAALGVPVVALFGPTDPQATGPGGEGHQIVRNDWWCSPCHLKACPYKHECLENITPDHVWSAIEKIVRGDRSCQVATNA
jgi:lipopolysaccharide heptosyltransferase II